MFAMRRQGRRARLVLSLWLYAGLALALTLSPLRARADDAATTHFSRGVELYDEGDVAAALVEFKRAHKLSPHYRVLYNIAQAQFQLQDYVSALATFRLYLAEGGEQLTPERKAEVAREITRLGGRIATVVIEVNEPGADLLVDDRRVGLTPLPQGLPVNSGRRRIRVQKAGFASESRELELAGGDSVALRFDLRPVGSDAAAAAGPMRPDVSPGSGSLVKTVGFVTLGVGVGVFVTGAIIDLGPLGSTIEDFRAASKRGDADAASLQSRASRERTIAMIGYVAGGALSAGGLALVLLAPNAHKSTGSAPALRAFVSGGRFGLDGRF